MELPRPEEPSGGAAAAGSVQNGVLQPAFIGDSVALGGATYCYLCSEPLLMEEIVTTPCKHHFHRVCIQRLDEPNCPLCNAQLPFSWFAPGGRPCAERGFRVVPAHEYRPRFPGGPSIGSPGFPFDRPPLESLFGPDGMIMRSYLHKVMPKGTEEDLDESPPRPHNSALAASASRSFANDFNNDWGKHAPSTSSGKNNHAKKWAYSAMGRMRLLEASVPANSVQPTTDCYC